MAEGKIFKGTCRKCGGTICRNEAYLWWHEDGHAQCKDIARWAKPAEGAAVVRNQR